MKLTFALILLTLSSYGRNYPIGYSPDYTEQGYLNIAHLNSGIFLASLQYDSVDIDLILPKGTYYLPNNKTIYLKPHVFLKCDSVTFIYKWVTYDYTQNIIEINNISNSGIKNLTIDFSQAYNDKRPTYENADKFVNRSIIQIEHSDSIFIQNVTIKKIIGSGIEISNSKWCQINDCNIIGSWVYGNENGSQGYGINLVGTMTAYNLIFNNTLKDQRHNFVIQYGAHENMISNNKCYEVKALKKLFFIEVMDKEFTFNICLHGNNPWKNVILENYCDHRISIDNVKTTGNGPGNELINNEVHGLIDVQSKAPYYSYNEGQTIRGNKYKKLRIEAKNCINENNTKIK